MVEIEEMNDVETSASEERLLDAQAIEEAAVSVLRPSAKMHMEALAKKLRKESAALKRVEDSRTKLESTTITDDGAPNKADATMQEPELSKPAVAATASRTAAVAAPVALSAKYIPVDRFSFDAGGYNSSHVTVYVSLPSVGSISRDLISCDFTASTLDLIVKDLNGKSYRLFKDNLEKDIDPEKSKYIVKADKIIIKLAKIKSEYGSYDYWTELTDTKNRKVTAQGKRKSDDPQASIMNLMKDMYESGDDNIRKVIGETMMKQQRGELDKDSMSGKGMGGFDDF